MPIGSFIVSGSRGGGRSAVVFDDDSTNSYMVAGIGAETTFTTGSVTGVNGTGGAGQVTDQIFVTPTLDGHATGTATAATTVAATLTTTHTNDIICALVHVENTTGSGTMWVTGIAGGSLTWQKRRGISNGSNNSTLELWWAVAASTLSSTTITATFNQTCDDSSILVFGVNGCNLSQPWDNNISLPAQHQFFSTAAPSIAGISTTQPNDFIIFGVGSTDNWTAIGTVPTGFTQIGFVNNPGGTNASGVGAAYKGVTSTQSNQTFAWGSTIPAAQFQCGIALIDALTANSGTLISVPQLECVNGTESTGTSDATAYAASPSPGDLIVLVSYCEVASGTAPTISSITGGGLSWTQRTRSHGSSFGSMEVWYCKPPGTLALTTLTVNYSAVFDTTSLICFSVNGNAVFDANGALPAHSSNTVPSNPWTVSASVTTTSTNDFIFALPGVRAASTNTTGPTGYQWITNQNATGGTNECDIAFAINTVGSTQSAVAVAWGTTLADSSGGEYIVDALTTNVPVTNGVAGTGGVGTFTVQISSSAHVSGASGTGVAGQAIVIPQFTQLNQADRIVCTLSNGFLTAVGSGNGGVRTVDSYWTGQYYYELTATTVAGNDCGIGVSKPAASLSTIASNATGACIAFDAGSGTIFLNGTSQSPTLGTWTNGSIISVALDVTNKLIYFRLNGGNWNASGTANPVTQTGGYSLSALALPYFGCVTVASGCSLTANFGATPFTYAVPASFTPGLPANQQLPFYAGNARTWQQINPINYEDEQLQDGWQLPQQRQTRSRTLGTTISSFTNANITGVSGTGSPGSPSIEIDNPLTGVTGTGGVGNTIAQVQPLVSGVQGTGQAASPSLEIDVPIVGVAGTGQAGNPTSETDRTVTLTGVAGTGQSGIAVIEVDHALTGVTGTGQSGTPTIEDDVSVVGVTGTGQAGVASGVSGRSASVVGAAGIGQSGTPSIEDDVSVVGVAASGQSGIPVIEIDCALIGVAASGQSGTPSIEDDVFVVGVTGTGQVGVPNAGSNRSAILTGVAASGQSGNPTIQENLPLTGVAASGQSGTPSIEDDVSVVGVMATGQGGTIFLGGGTRSVSVTGVAGTAQIGVFTFQKSTTGAATGAAGIGLAGIATSGLISAQPMMMICL